MLAFLLIITFLFLYLIFTLKKNDTILFLSEK